MGDVSRMEHALEFSKSMGHMVGKELTPRLPNEYLEGRNRELIVHAFSKGFDEGRKEPPTMIEVDPKKHWFGKPSGAETGVKYHG